jgi:epsilon-lactone hydrolase
LHSLDLTNQEALLPSLKANILNLYLKWSLKRHPLHLLDPEKLRAGTDRMAPNTPPAGITIEKRDDAAVKGEWHRSENAEAGNLIFYLHGGGYVFGSAKSHRAVTFALAAASKADVFSLNYRMAPEHPFPAAVDDALDAYRWLLDQSREPQRIIVAGDSAGGGLALALLLAARDHGLPMPAGAVLYSPWTDLATTGASLSENEKTDVMFKKIYIVEGAKKYLGGANPQVPLASPLYADLAGLPPILTFASDSEVLYSDSVRLHERLNNADVSSQFIIEKGLGHVWPIFVGKMPEADRSVAQSAEFIRERFGAADAS